MKIDLQNSPWMLVLLLGLFSLVVLMVVALIFPKATQAAIAFAGVWAGLIVTALTIGMAKAKRNGDP